MEGGCSAQVNVADVQAEKVDTLPTPDAEADAKLANDSDVGGAIAKTTLSDAEPKKEGKLPEPLAEPVDAKLVSDSDAGAVSPVLDIAAWLGVGPEGDSPVYQAIQQHFPGALPGQVVLARAVSALRPHGLDPDNTIYGQSICPDEINNEKGDLASIMQEYWGECFPMGGIGGAPYVGQTGFGAFAAHVPENGHVLILFGPHVAISETGELTKYLRKGQSKESTACGAVCAAYNSCCSGPLPEDDPLDMQQDWLKKKVSQQIDNIKAAKDPMQALFFVAYEAVKDKVLAIINHKYGAGNLVLLGGIQINMPAPFEDQFLPLMFRISSASNEPTDLLSAFKFHMDPAPRSPCRSLPLRASVAAAKSGNKLFSWLDVAPPPDSPCFKSLHAGFPGSIPGRAVLHRCAHVLHKYGLEPGNVIYGQSICPDEINNEKGDLAWLMKDYWGSCFPMGGIGGAPYVGKTGFMAFSNHVPDDGHVLILFGPHVAVSADGEIGRYLRIGQSNKSGACGAVLAAHASASAGKVHDDKAYDMQQSWLHSQIAKEIEKINASEMPIAAVTHEAFAASRDIMLQITNQNFGNGYLVLIGGIQINMPAPYEDQFQPLFFRVTSKTESFDLLKELLLP